MTRWLPVIFGVFGVFFFTGCPEPEGQGPIIAEPRRPDVVEIEERPASGSIADADLETRQQSLVVMAAEQRDAIRRIDRATHLTRVSDSTAEQVLIVLAPCENDLAVLEREVRALDRDDSLSRDDRHDRQDELKARLRRVAARLARIEAALQ